MDTKYSDFDEEIWVSLDFVDSRSMLYYTLSNSPPSEVEQLCKNIRHHELILIEFFGTPHWDIPALRWFRFNRWRDRRDEAKDKNPELFALCDSIIKNMGRSELPNDRPSLSEYFEVKEEILALQTQANQFDEASNRQDNQASKDRSSGDGNSFLRAS